MTAGRGKREYGLFLSPCYRPNLALELSLSSSPPSEPHGCLAQPKYWGTTDMRKHTPRLQLQNPLLDTHTKKEEPAFLLLEKSLRYALQFKAMQQFCQVTNFMLWDSQVLYSLSPTPAEHFLKNGNNLKNTEFAAFSLTVQHIVLGAMQQEISEKKQAKTLIHSDISIYWRQGHIKPMTKNWRQWKATVLSPHIVCVLAKELRHFQSFPTVN